jgi:hypothetical protein
MIAKGRRGFYFEWLWKELSKYAEASFRKDLSKLKIILGLIGKRAKPHQKQTAAGAD